MTTTTIRRVRNLREMSRGIEGQVELAEGGHSVRLSVTISPIDKEWQAIRKQIEDLMVARARHAVTTLVEAEKKPSAPPMQSILVLASNVKMAEFWAKQNQVDPKRLVVASTVEGLQRFRGYSDREVLVLDPLEHVDARAAYNELANPRSHYGLTIKHANASSVA